MDSLKRLLCNSEAVLISPRGLDGWAAAMLTDIVDAISMNRIPCRLHFLDGEESLQALRRQVSGRAKAGGDVVVLGVNGLVDLHLPEAEGRIRHVAILLDQPAFHLHKFAGFRSPLTLTVMDETQVDAPADLGAFFPTLFLPHGGPPLMANACALEDRDIDVLFCGNVAQPLFDGRYMNRLDSLPEDLRRVTVGAAWHAGLQGMPPHEALITGCVEAGVDPISLVEHGLGDACELLEQLICSRERLRVMRGLVRLPRAYSIHLVGNMPTALPEFVRALARLSHVTVHGSLSYDRIKKLMARSRMVVNSSASVVGGGHERIWDAVAQGAAVVTTRSSFVRRHFPEEEAMLFLPREEDDLMTMVESWLGHPTRLRDLAASAGMIYRHGHTWKHRIAGLWSMLHD